MLIIKQINAKVKNNIYHIDEPLNEFIKTLPGKGNEVQRICYFKDQEYGMGVRTAIVEYEGRDPNADQDKGGNGVSDIASIKPVNEMAPRKVP